MRAIRVARLLAAVIALTGWAVGGGAHAQAIVQGAASAAILDDTVIDAGFAIYRVKRIEVYGSTLSSADLHRLFDANDPQALPERLRSLNAERIVVPEIVAELKAGSAGEKSVTYHNLVLTGVKDGHVADASAHDVAFDVGNEQAGRISGEYSALAAHNLDLVLAGRIATSSRSDANESKALLYESFSLSGGRLAVPKQNFELTFGRASGSGVKGRPFRTPLSTLPKQDDAPRELTPEEARTMSGFSADVLDSFDLGNLEMSDIAVKGVSEAKPFNAHLDRMTLSGVGDAKIEQLSFDGFSTSTSDDARINLAGIAFRGFDMSALLGRLRKAAKEGGESLDKASPREILPNLREFSLTGFEYRAPSPGAIASGAGRDTPVRIGKVEIRSGGALFEGIPTALTASVDGVSFGLSPTSADDTLRTIAGLGYSSVDAGSSFDIAWRQASKELVVTDFSIAVAGMYAMKTKGLVTNVSQDVFASQPAVVQAAALAALIKTVDLAFTDQGLLDRMIAKEAAKSGRTPDAIRREWVTAAGVGIPAALGDAPAGRTIGAAVSKFIASPKTLHISASAPNGIGAAEFALFSRDPAEFLKRVDVQAEAD
ncbi:MAG: hypothetical protein NVS2B5_19310 [Beijerinckiaceae bacterium]